MYEYIQKPNWWMAIPKTPREHLKNGAEKGVNDPFEKWPKLLEYLASGKDSVLLFAEESGVRKLIQAPARIVPYDGQYFAQLTDGTGVYYKISADTMVSIWDQIRTDGVIDNVLYVISLVGIREGEGEFIIVTEKKPEGSRLGRGFYRSVHK